jgi:hypothetical protein
MVEMGATTFWESWSGAGAMQADGRLTRSHCHGWSAAPTYFLSTYVLGVQAAGPAPAPIRIEPHPGDLRWCRGVTPTHYGDVAVQWENPVDGPFTLRVQAPAGCPVEIKPPREGQTWLNGQSV